MNKLRYRLSVSGDGIVGLIFWRNQKWQVGETGRTVGVEHIPELVDRSIDAIKQTPAGSLMDMGRLEVIRMLSAPLPFEPYF
jgi:hypothetical protein